MPSAHRPAPRLAPHLWLTVPALVGAAALAAAACGPPPATAANGASTADADTTSSPTASPTETASATGSPTGSPTSIASGGTLPECRLPAPKKSEDPCKTDADCGPSDPCHAHACVAKAKANPPNKSTMCTYMMDCQSIDANPCTCFEGVCALVPGKQ